MMTFTKLAYISTKDFQPICLALEECGFEDNYSQHTDSAEEEEFWVELDEENYVLDTLKNYGFISRCEYDEIVSNKADTVLFY